MFKNLLICATSLAAISTTVLSASESGGTVKMVYCQSGDQFTFDTFEAKTEHNGSEKTVRFIVSKNVVGANRFKMMYASILHAQATGFKLWINVDDQRNGPLSWSDGTHGHYTQAGRPAADCNAISVNK